MTATNQNVDKLYEERFILKEKQAVSELQEHENDEVAAGVSLGSDWLGECHEFFLTNQKTL